MRRKLTAVILAVIAFALIAASAASLNGINTADLGADATLVASCDTDGVTVRYLTRYEPAIGEYELRRVIVRGISDACIGQELSVTVSNGTDEVSRGPWTINNRPGVDNNGRGWGIAAANIPHPATSRSPSSSPADYGSQDPLKAILSHPITMVHVPNEGGLPVRKKLTAIVLAVLVFSLIAASAASLGGIATADLGADVELVASCDTDGVTAAFGTSYDATALEYVVDDVTIGAIDGACVGQAIEVTLTDAAGAALGTYSGTVTGASETLPSAGTVLAEAVEGIAVVISG